MRIAVLVPELGYKTQRAMAKGLGISKSTLNRYIKTDRCPDPHILHLLTESPCHADGSAIDRTDFLTQLTRPGNYVEFSPNSELWAPASTSSPTTCAC